LLKQRKNKTFQYHSRFSKENQENPNNDDASKTEGFILKWRSHRELSKKKRKGGLSVKLLIFILVLLLICMYLLENRFK
jgi:hypothetical protein